MYLLCFLYTGSLPILKIIKESSQDSNISDFVNIVCTKRIEMKEFIHSEIKRLIPESMASAFSYIVGMKHEEKPNY